MSDEGVQHHHCGDGCFSRWELVDNGDGTVTVTADYRCGTPSTVAVLAGSLSSLLGLRAALTPDDFDAAVSARTTLMPDSADELDV